MGLKRTLGQAGTGKEPTDELICVTVVPYEHERTAYRQSPSRGLVNNQISEGRDLGFKRELPGGGDGTALEFPADVTAFGNALGDDIVFSVDDPDPSAFRPTTDLSAILATNSLTWP